MAPPRVSTAWAIFFKAGPAREDRISSFQPKMSTYARTRRLNDGRRVFLSREISSSIPMRAEDDSPAAGASHPRRLACGSIAQATRLVQRGIEQRRDLLARINERSKGGWLMPRNNDLNHTLRESS